MRLFAMLRNKMSALGPDLKRRRHWRRLAVGRLSDDSGGSPLKRRLGYLSLEVTAHRQPLAPLRDKWDIMPSNLRHLGGLPAIVCVAAKAAARLSVT